MMILWYKWRKITQRETSKAYYTKLMAPQTVQSFLSIFQTHVFIYIIK